MSTITAKALADAQYAQVSPTSAIYTAPAATRTIIDKMTATNTDASARTITVNIVPSSGTLGGGNTITSAVSIAAGAVYDLSEMKNQILSSGDGVWASASVGSKVVVRLSGREIV
jgi:hypothetical protein